MFYKYAIFLMLFAKKNHNKNLKDRIDVIVENILSKKAVQIKRP